MNVADGVQEKREHCGMAAHGAAIHARMPAIVRVGARSVIRSDQFSLLQADNLDGCYGRSSDTVDGTIRRLRRGHGSGDKAMVTVCERDTRGQEEPQRDERQAS